MVYFSQIMSIERKNRTPELYFLLIVGLYQLFNMNNILAEGGDV